MAYNPSAFEARRRSYLENFAAEGAMNAYKNTLSQQRGQRNLAQYKTRAQNTLWRQEHRNRLILLSQDLVVVV